jgi:hypothetical protein
MTWKSPEFSVLVVVAMRTTGRSSALASGTISNSRDSRFAK